MREKFKRIIGVDITIGMLMKKLFHKYRNKIEFGFTLTNARNLIYLICYRQDDYIKGKSYTEYFVWLLGYGEKGEYTEANQSDETINNILKLFEDGE